MRTSTPTSLSTGVPTALTCKQYEALDAVAAAATKYRAAVISPSRKYSSVGPHVAALKKACEALVAFYAENNLYLDAEDHLTLK